MEPQTQPALQARAEPTLAGEGLGQERWILRSGFRGLGFGVKIRGPIFGLYRENGKQNGNYYVGFLGLY